MATVNIHEAKTHLSRLVERAAAGEEIVIARNGRPVARLIGLQEDDSPRVPGSMRGLITIADDFDDPLPPDLLAAFNGED
jgi:prevent-host-death family protein